MKKIRTFSIGLISPAALLILSGCDKRAEEATEYYYALEKSGGTPDQLCTAAQTVETAWRTNGDAREAENWASIRTSKCISAQACAVIVGGCQ